ncbi:hypothetical protein MRX96_023792 [Rhipicephalus microplus]
MNYRSSTEFRHVRNSGPGGVDAPISLAGDSPGLFVASSAGVLRTIIYDDDIMHDVAPIVYVFKVLPRCFNPEDADVERNTKKAPC